MKACDVFALWNQVKTLLISNYHPITIILTIYGLMRIFSSSNESTSRHISALCFQSLQFCFSQYMCMCTSSEKTFVWPILRKHNTRFTLMYMHSKHSMHSICSLYEPHSFICTSIHWNEYEKKPYEICTNSFHAVESVKIFILHLRKIAIPYVTHTSCMFYYIYRFRLLRQHIQTKSR